MKSILKIIKGKPSNALQHMVDGLLKQSKRKDFKIHMATYGESSQGICYGCAATCAVQNLTKVNFISNRIDNADDRATITKTSWGELNNFECAINQARQGNLRPLFTFCEIYVDHCHSFNSDFNLQDEDWQQQLPKVRTLIRQLKKAGY